MTSISFSQPAQSTLSDEQVYRILFAVTFVFFFAAASIIRFSRLVTGRSRPAGIPRSLFGEAKATAYSTLLFAFMG